MSTMGRKFPQNDISPGSNIPARMEIDNTLTGERFDTSNLGQAEFFNGLNLRLLRRSRGLSQVELSELLGVTQPNISRWEAGAEKTPLRIQQQLQEILFEGTRVENKFILGLTRSNPNVTVLQLNQYSLPILQLSHYAASLLSCAPEDVVGKDYRRVFKSEWFDEVFRSRPLSDFALVNVHHDLQPDERHGSNQAVRSHTSLYVLHPVDEVPLVVASARYSTATGEPPKVSFAQTVNDLAP